MFKQPSRKTAGVVYVHVLLLYSKVLHLLPVWEIYFPKHVHQAQCFFSPLVKISHTATIQLFLIWQGKIKTQGWGFGHL